MSDGVLGMFNCSEVTNKQNKETVMKMVALLRYGMPMEKQILTKLTEIFKKLQSYLCKFSVPLKCHLRISIIRFVNIFTCI